MAFAKYVEIFEKITKLKGWNSYRLAKALGIPQSSLRHYARKPVSTREKLLVELQKISGLSIEDFWALLERDVKSVQQNEVKKK